jgi:hypothetical protein
MKKINRIILSLSLVVSMLLIAPVMAAPNEKAWRTVSAVQLSNTSVKYDQLTTACAGWGLSGNPYPSYLPLASGVKGTAYMIFTIQIGDDVFKGVSCNTYTQTYVVSGVDPVTTAPILEIHEVYDAVWYLGDWGKDNARMNSGFSGTVDVYIHSYNMATKTYTYYNAVFDLEGFQRFNHQSLHLIVPDSRTSLMGTGVCNVLGNRDKM